VRLTDATIVGHGVAIPEGRLTNHDLEARVDTTDAWIVERTGIRERRIAGPDESTATLATTAAAAAPHVPPTIRRNPSTISGDQGSSSCAVSSGDIVPSRIVLRYVAV
jgi:3-oxoacyl-[acyl-carrier-protein] synthase III